MPWHEFHLHLVYGMHLMSPVLWLANDVTKLKYCSITDRFRYVEYNLSFYSPLPVNVKAASWQTESACDTNKLFFSLCVGQNSKNKVINVGFDQVISDVLDDVWSEIDDISLYPNSMDKVTAGTSVMWDIQHNQRRSTHSSTPTAIYHKPHARLSNIKPFV